MIPFEGNEFLVLPQEKNDHLHELSVYVFLASDKRVKTRIIRFVLCSTVYCSTQPFRNCTKST